MTNIEIVILCKKHIPYPKHEDLLILMNFLNTKIKPNIKNKKIKTLLSLLSSGCYLHDFFQQQILKVNSQINIAEEQNEKSEYIISLLEKKRKFFNKQITQKSLFGIFLIKLTLKLITKRSFCVL
ncbi:hypothetical protein IMG5_001750 [Ichthyophthirius multifiliis]|uniref:Uncharacterized protein n=1 Tax=Ichthyophthirius multifiliis TaxID=5932 RepID=G0QJ05_ICHMU|nr:hypothetical protein IMG5_001750 [Ichthyophthirius multifiliis]EGR34798.1 hypothetical protein IMG5_001750 [Ichthyophthirius multifiliis]|eukprot:XP_004040102.1 hypothetical protein IMG5_001750 [Ichthyophthirius multifiliis]